MSLTVMKRNLKLLTVLSCTAVFLWIGGAAPKDSSSFIITSTVHAAPTPEKSSYSGYKGVMIGLPAVEARKKLGNPKDTSETQDFYVFSDNESAQVYYDGTKNVSLVSVSYVGKLDVAPSPRDIFGEEVQAKPDGSVFKMVRYPKAGYWISYNRTPGDDPIVTITVQKLQN